MHTTVNKEQFKSAMRDHANYTETALELLWDYYEELESDLGESIQFDPIAIRCEWWEHDAVEISVDYDKFVGADPCADAEDIHWCLTDYTTSLGPTEDNKVLFVGF
jgi:hypothetical protein